MNNRIKIIGILLSLFLLDIIWAGPIEAGEASLILTPASESFLIEEIFPVELKVDTAGEPINAVHVDIIFPSDKLEIVNVSKENSIFSIWPEEPILSDSKISFSGGLPHPGFTGTGKIITINFKARKEGVVNLILGEGKVLADDGKGTDILVFIKEAKYSIYKEVLSKELVVFSPTHPDPEEWYNNNNPRFQWELGSETKGASFILDKNPTTVPDSISEEIVKSKNFENIEDGIWYFHLKLANEIEWGSPAHYKLKVDTSPPHPFDITIDNAGDPTNPNPNLYFETKDDISGINYYKFKIGKEKFSELMTAQVSPFTLSGLSAGQHQITVRAADMAGNNVEAETIIGIEPIESPEIVVYPQAYISGEEVFYLEGESLPEAEITIILKKEGKEVRKWQVFSDSKGEWSFSSKELMESGTYYLSVQAKDKRGAISELSGNQRIEVSFSGMLLGPFLLSFKKLVLILISIIIIGIIVASYFLCRIRQTKKTLKKETKEAQEILNKNFNELRKEIEKRIEMFDSRPGFSEKEKAVYDDLKKFLDKSEDSIKKEIDDIEKGLK